VEGLFFIGLRRLQPGQMALSEALIARPLKQVCGQPQIAYQGHADRPDAPLAPGHSMHELVEQAHRPFDSNIFRASETAAVSAMAAVG